MDVISRRLVSMLIMTFLSAAIAGLLALQEGKLDLVKRLLTAAGFCLAHATNGLLNDYTDHQRSAGGLLAVQKAALSGGCFAAARARP